MLILMISESGIGYFYREDVNPQLCEGGYNDYAPLWQMNTQRVCVEVLSFFLK